MRNNLVIALFPLFFFLSCNEAKKDPIPDLISNDSLSVKHKPVTGYFHINKDSILKDFSTWYDYTYHNILLGQDFIGLDTDSLEIDKAQFLAILSKGDWVAFRTAVVNDVPVYRLEKVRGVAADVSSTIKQLADNEINHFKAEGSEFPDYTFVDLEGNQYEKSTDQGNIVLIKCWFINCVACVKEFPELNALVDEYNGRIDIKFVSLATDAGKDLQAFLSARKFKYAVVPGSGNFMSKVLKIDSYPTHILIGKNGKIVKISNSIKDIKPSLRKLAG
jgi:thiol-disulfide isomerase/thioredoxin